MPETVTIATRFRGPPSSGNGGYSAGLAAKALGGAVAEVTLFAPPPLEAPLAVVRDGPEIVLVAGEREIVRARPADLSDALDFEPPDPPSAKDAKAAAKRCVGVVGQHIFPGCFVCGPERKAGDGLRIFPGALKAGDGVAAPWTPGKDLADDDGLVGREFLWAALDCPSYFALPRAGELMALLGRMTAEVRERPEPGEALVAAAWPAGAEGRKHASRSALYGADGRVLARAACLWIEIKERPKPA
jgi:hypothetical protein